MPGVCGDPYIDYNNQGNSEYFQPSYACDPASYESGSEFQMDVTLTANHGGFLKCSVCDQQSAADWTDACFEGNDLTTCARLCHSDALKVFRRTYYYRACRYLTV